MKKTRNKGILSNLNYIVSNIGVIGIGVFLLYTEVANFNNGTIPNGGKGMNSVTTYANEPFVFILVILAVSVFGLFLTFFGIWRLISYIFNNPKISEN